MSGSDLNYMFESHNIRGLAKMNLRVTTIFSVMLELKKAELKKQH